MALEAVLRALTSIQTQCAVGYTLLLTLAVGLVLYLRWHRSKALHVDASPLFLHVFEPFLWVLIAAAGVLSALLWTAVAAQDSLWIDSPISFAAGYSLRQFLFLFVLLYFYQLSATPSALKRSSALASVLSVLPLAFELSARVVSIDDAAACLLHIVYRLCLCGLHVWILLWPRTRASSWSLCSYSLYSLVLQLLHAGIGELYRQSRPDFSISLWSLAVMLTAAAGVLDATLPLFVWWLLIADTKHWRGQGARTNWNLNWSAEVCAVQVKESVATSDFHDLLENHRSYVLEKSHILFDIDKCVGIGATSTVYKGRKTKNKQGPVAIKVYTPLEVNSRVVASFSHEAAVMSSLQHPNIANFLGICVCPPLMCLVSELCPANLLDMLATQTLVRHYLALDLCMMLDAARGVAYLHSLKPPLLHRDIKPTNLVVDSNYVVKLTDFGSSCELKGNAMLSAVGTVEYMAPEVIACIGKQGIYTEAVDVYSLAITLWDILHPCEDKFPTAHRANVCDLVRRGIRPAIDPSVPPPLRALLEMAWCEDPRQRPTAESIAISLELLLRDVLQPVAHELKHHLQSNSFRGDQLVSYLLDQELVQTSPQAVRLGNALMDAGYLHHGDHLMGFRNESAVYTLELHAVPSSCGCQLLAQGHRHPTQKRPLWKQAI